MTSTARIGPFPGGDRLGFLGMPGQSLGIQAPTATLKIIPDATRTSPQQNPHALNAANPGFLSGRDAR